MKRQHRATAALATIPLLLTACGGGGEESGEGEIRYWLWDANQLPAYEECAANFEEENSDITINIEQLGWDDYWNRLTADMVANDAPDVFVNHLAHYPQLVANGQLLPIEEQVEREGIDLSIYQEGLADLWVGQDGSRYGLPKDWDTIALVYNTEIVEEAGLTPEDLAEMEWNPDDGGTYEEVIARLTIDAEGVRGDEPGFDADNVEVYGLGLQGSGGGFGQTEWSPYAFGNNWQHTDENPWGSEFNYDAPEFQETIEWWRSLIEKGYMPSLAIADSGVGMMDAFGAGNYAMVTEGSWNTNAYFSMEGVESGLAPTPIGPSGERASMFNGLADSIFSGTENPEAAWRWVSYLASPECQNTVAEHAVVFPAIGEATEAAQEAFAANDIDVSAFTQHVENGTTYLAPITEHWAEVGAVMDPAMDAVLSFEADTDSLSEANEEVNALFE